MNFLTFETLTGRSEIHISTHPKLGIPLHKGAQSAFILLQNEAAKEGFDLRALSGFRSYERQKKIWQEKASGKRQLLDDQGHPLAFEKLNEAQVLEAILRWSAIPGVSRHHWGTDLDIYDHNALPHSDYKIELTPEEVDAGGIFSPLHEWLDYKIEQNKSWGFFRPYQLHKGGVAPERWHISYRPLSHIYYEAYDINIFLENILESDLLLQNHLIEGAFEIFKNYMKNVER